VSHLVIPTVSKGDRLKMIWPVRAEGVDIWRIVWLRDSLEESNGVHLRRLICSYRSQDSFPCNPTITIFNIRYQSTFIIPLSSCFMRTTYHAMSHEIATYHDTITPYAQPMLYSSHAFICMLFISAYEACQSSPCDFGLDQSDAVPTPQFSMKPIHLVRC